jgi:integrase/recombinase XerD
VSPTRATTRPGPRKSALRVASLPGGASSPQDFLGPAQESARRNGRSTLTVAELREASIAEFASWLRQQTSPKTKRPYQEKTVTLYCDAARALHQWMTAEKVDADFTECDTRMLNRFFAAYLKSHTQGGTNTHQRNLGHLFQWLEAVYGVPSPYTAMLQKYAPSKARPSTLADEFIADLLEVTGGGRARSFEDVRDHAIIRVFTEGPRITEISSIQLSDLPFNLIAQPLFHLTPLKGARRAEEGRIQPVGPATARSMVVYLRARQSHRLADSPALWLGTRHRGPMTSSGIYQMFKRRADQAGYDPGEVHPHMMRDTFVNNWLANGGSEGDLMRLMGWTDRSMVDRYSEDVQAQRAVQARLQRDDIY